MADPIKQLAELQQWEKEIQAERNELMVKAMKSSDPETLLKAQSLWDDVQPRSNAQSKTILFDPLNVQTTLNYKEHTSNVTASTLRRMSKAPVIRAIIGTRIEQVVDFGQPQQKDHSPGFLIRKKKSIYGDKKQEKMTLKEQKRAEWLTEFVMNCGNSFNSWTGDDFDIFLRKFTSDCLTLDQGVFEVIRNRKGDPLNFAARDGSLFRKAPDWNDPRFLQEYQTDIQELPAKILGYYPSHIQLMNNQVVQEFYPWELCMGIRNPSTSIYSNGYGTSELEDLIRVITWMLYSDDYNGKFFSQGSSPKGILKVVGQTNEARLAEFRQQWMAMVQGVQNAWRTPILEGDKVDWIDLQKSNNDMEFAKWQEYLVRLACAIYKISPDEIGFEITKGSQGQGGLGNSANDNKEHSRNKGLKPLLRFIQKKINKFVINPLDPEYEFVFVGLGDDEEDELDLDIKKLSSYMTINEIREKRNLPPIEGGDVIANAQFIQAQQAAMYGNPESNEVVDEEGDYTSTATDDALQYNTEDDLDVEKSESNDPLLSSFLSYHDEINNAGK